MTTSSRIIDTLKRQLKVRGITYRGLAESTGNFSLRRLDDVCAVLELDIGDLVNISESQEPKIEQLSAEHEQEIVGDTHLLLVAYCLINYWSFDEIIRRYDISPITSAGARTGLSRNSSAAMCNPSSSATISRTTTPCAL